MQGSKLTPPPPLPDGWWVATWYDSSTEIKKLTASWVVPTAPKANGALIYLFPSIEPSGSGGAIVQPVLQYGVSPAGGGNYWAMANWYVTSTTRAYTLPVQVKAGDSITGTMSRDSSLSGTWGVSYAVGGVTRSQLFSTAYTSWKAVQGGVLEVYSITACNQLPASNGVTFTGIKVETFSGVVTPNFTNHKWQSSCSANATSTSTTAKLTWAS